MATGELINGWPRLIIFPCGTNECTIIYPFTSLQRTVKHCSRVVVSCLTMNSLLQSFNSCMNVLPGVTSRAKLFKETFSSTDAWRPNLLGHIASAILSAIALPILIMTLGRSHVLTTLQDRW